MLSAHDVLTAPAQDAPEVKAIIDDINMGNSGSPRAPMFIVQGAAGWIEGTPATNNCATVPRGNELQSLHPRKGRGRQRHDHRHEEHRDNQGDHREAAHRHERPGEDRGTNGGYPPAGGESDAASEPTTWETTRTVSVRRWSGPDAD